MSCQFTLTLDTLVCAVVLLCSHSLLISVKCNVIVSDGGDGEEGIWQREEGFIPKLAHILHMLKAVDPGLCHTYFSQNNSGSTHSQSFISLSLVLLQMML